MFVLFCEYHAFIVHFTRFIELTIRLLFLSRREFHNWKKISIKWQIAHYIFQLVKSRSGSHEVSR